MRNLNLFALLALSACGGSAPAKPEDDLDGDGYTAADGDCDDADADLTPDTVWYTDNDGDGFGADSTQRTACQRNPNEVSVAGDCDDARAEASPDGVEVCDSEDVDENCNGTADDADATTDASTKSAFVMDSDGDGFVPESGDTLLLCDGDGVSGDCDDGDPSISPDAAELCDADDVDENCNGRADDADETVLPSSLLTFWSDDDGDGYGDALDAYACDLAPGRTETSGDCDDAVASTHPGATEDCGTGGVDDNCDGATNAIDATGCVAFYADADGDGFAGNDAVCACDAVGAHVYTSIEDCDDADAGTFPGAAAEASGTTLCMRDADRDGYGDIIATAPFDAGTDCDDLDGDTYPGGALEARETTACLEDHDGDGFGASAPRSAFADLGTDCDDALRSVTPAGDEPPSANGVDDDCDGVVDEVERQWLPTGVVPLRKVSALRATAVTNLRALAAGQIDGSGSNDIVTVTSTGAVAAWYSDVQRYVASSSSSNYALQTGGAIEVVPSQDSDTTDEIWLGSTSAGAVYVLENTSYPIRSFATLTSSTLTNGVGAAIATVGDVLSDGHDAVLVSATHVPASGSFTSEVFLLPGDALPSTGTLEASAVATFVAGASSDGAGWSTSGGHDIDGDGVDDMVISAPYSSLGSAGGGAVYLQLGDPALSGRLTLGADSDATSRGATASQYAGMSVASLGDTDGDGYGDVVVGAPATSSRPGVTYLLSGAAWPTSLAASSAVITGTTGDGFGAAVEAIGDFDDDGTNDFVVLAPDETSGGSAYVFYDAPTGAVSKTSATATLQGASTFDVAAVTRLGDIDDDGADDFALAMDDYGIVYVHAHMNAWNLAAVDDTTFTYAGTEPSSSSSATLGSQALVMDLDRDGTRELVAGAYLGATTTDSPTGAAGYGAVYAWEPTTTSATTSAARGIVSGSSSGASVYVGRATLSVDVSGDGWDDLVVSSAQRLYTFGSGSLPADAATVSSLTPAYSSAANMEPALARMSDVNGDGREEVVLGDMATSTGEVRILLGGTTFTTHATFTGETAGDDLGASVAVGDLDEDGYDDIVVGAPYEDSAASSAGAVYVLYGPFTSGTRSVGTASVVLRGSGASAGLGRSVAISDDVDGDGIRDVLLGEPGSDTVYVVSGILRAGDYTVTAAASAMLEPTSAADCPYNSTEWGLGTAVTAIGDVNGDGLGDIAATCPTSTMSSTPDGALGLFMTPLDRMSPLWLNPGPQALGSYQTASGRAVVAADVDGDGITNIVHGLSIGMTSSNSDGALGVFSVDGMNYWDAVEHCDDGTDNDDDGSTDCFDTDCTLASVCTSDVETDCADGIDNDVDGTPDCYDLDCASDAGCSGRERTCTDGLDDDSDRAADCLDTDCLRDAACVPRGSEERLGSASSGSPTGSPVATGTTSGRTNAYSSSCGGYGYDVAYAWVAPSAGTWTFDLSGSTFNTVLSLRSLDGTIWTCDDDSGTGTTSLVTRVMRAGEPLVIVVDGYSGTSYGNYELRIY